MRRFFGSTPDWRQALIISGYSVAAAVVYTVIAANLAPDAMPGWKDFVGTATALASVWLTRKQNVLCWPLGIVSVIRTPMSAPFSRISPLNFSIQSPPNALVRLLS